MDAQLGTRDIWILDLARGTRERLTSETGDEFAPVWSPAGDRIIYSALRKGSIELFERRANGSGTERKLDAGGSALGKFAASWSRDGRAVLFVAGGRIISRSDIHVVNPDGGGAATPWLESGFVETQPRFSPDSALVAYASNESGRLQVYLRPFAGGSATRVSIDGGGWPRWRGDGRELYYLAPDDSLMAVAVSASGGTITVETPRPLFKVRLRPRGRLDSFLYDVTRDGHRFLVNSFVEQAGSSGMTLLTNWTASVR
jgi:Tol biopolymer transport system component